MSATTPHPFRVLIAGGGVAGLEAVLALRELAGERIATTMLAPQDEFVYRPMRVREPFAYSAARHYPLDEIARDTGITWKRDAFKWLDPGDQVVHTEQGDVLEYDALLLALGGVAHVRFKHALTIDDRLLDQQLHGLIQDVEGGYVSKLAFISPSPMPWPLPLYELALMTARRAQDAGIKMAITIATPEDAPLAVFGSAVSDGVRHLLDAQGIVTLTSSYCETPAPGQVTVLPSGERLDVDRVVALPELFGPSVPGVPRSAANGFISVDAHCRVIGLDRVFAAGDATNFPVKFGGIAAQQADTAAEAIASLAGAAVKPAQFHPVVQGVLLGADKPLYLSAHITGGHGSSSQISETPSSSGIAKITARYLSPYLEARDQAKAGAA
jgi:sulfide:quinone oxidoreductase